MKTQEAKHPPQRPWNFRTILDRVGEKVADGHDRLLPAKQAAVGAPAIIDELVGLKDEHGQLRNKTGSPFVLEKFGDAPEDQRFLLARVASVQEARDELAGRWLERLAGRQSERLDRGTLVDLTVDALYVVGPPQKKSCGPNEKGCDQLLEEFFHDGETSYSTPDRPRIVGIPLLRQRIEEAKDINGNPFDLRAHFERCLNKACP